MHRVWTFLARREKRTPWERIGVQRVIDRLHAATGFLKQALCMIKREFEESGKFAPTPKKPNVIRFHVLSLTSMTSIDQQFDRLFMLFTKEIHKKKRPKKFS